jgi:hypothetical protein
MTLNGLAVVFLGILVRFVLPIAATLLVISLFQKLDAKWQAEARQQLRAHMALAAANHTPCWEQRQCSAERRETCLAYQSSQVPCWQVFRDKDGRLRESCLECDVFLAAPVPVIL